MAAQQAVPLSSKRVVVIPSKTVPQGISALLVMDPTAGDEANLPAIEAAIAQVKTVQITYASRDSDFDGTPIRAGQYLALLENALLSSDDEFDLLLAKTLAAIENDAPSFITVFYGEDVEEAAAQECAKVISAKFPMAEVSVLHGGQPVYYYMISIE